MQNEESGEEKFPLKEMERLEKMVLRMQESYLAIREENSSIKRDLALLEAEKNVLLAEQERLLKEHGEIGSRVVSLIQRIDFWDKSFIPAASVVDENLAEHVPAQDNEQQANSLL